MLCSALSWLSSLPSNVPDFLLSPTSSTSSLPSWVSSQHISTRQHEITQFALNYKTRIETYKTALNNLTRKTTSNNSLRTQRVKNEAHNATSTDVNDDLSDYSDSDLIQEEPISSQDSNSLLKHRIIFLSRTHSQLIQAISEYKKTIFHKQNKFNVAVLGSRKLLCHVASVVNSSDPSDACKKLRNKKQCDFYKLDKINGCIGQLFQESLDIEELQNFGSKYSACSYFASKTASKDAHLIFAPYQSLLLEPENLYVKDSIIIVDEAHNLSSAIESIFTSELKFINIESSEIQLNNYLQKFHSRLSPKNFRNCRLLLKVVQNLKRILTAQSDDVTSLTLVDFFELLSIENINESRLVNWAHLTNLSFKISNFKSKNSENQNQTTDLLPVLSFLKSLNQSNNVIKLVLNSSFIKTIPVDSLNVFERITSSSKAVILTGATLFPVNDLICDLFTISFKNFQSFTFPHIISSSSVLPIICSKGPCNYPLRFTYQNRSNKSHNEDFSTMLVNLMSTCRGGMVVFFPSRDSMTCFNHFLIESGYNTSFTSLFIEPETTTDYSEFFNNFSRSVKLKTTVLFAVLGGKLSEGINLADNLCRICVIAGYSSPNPNDFEYNLKNSSLISRVGSQTCSDFWTSKSMRLVNQAAGRVIRHVSDYGVVVFADERFSNPKINAHISEWMRGSLKVCNSFRECLGLVNGFFKNKC
ncbi:hypothetical protein RCL1_007802 [Eukaryota sp. TZLM3-RCL]